MIFAYLDPGSGSLILQAVLGGAAGIGVAAKAMRRRWQTRNIDLDDADAASDPSVEADDAAEPEHQDS